MLRYRALLIDTERSYERPVQAHFTVLRQAKDWGQKALAKAGGKATVVIYRVTEIEILTMARESNDQIPVPGVQQATQETSKP